MENLSIHGKQIFKSKTDLQANLPTDAIQERFKNVIEPISTFNTFMEKTALPYVMTLDFSNMNSSQSSILDNYLRNFSSMDTCVGMNDSKHFLNWESIQSTFIKNEIVEGLIDQLDEDLTYLENRPLSFGTFFEDYKKVLANICYSIFKQHYHTIAKAFPNFMNDMSDSNLLAHRMAIMKHVEEHASKDPGSFVKHCSSDEEDKSSYWNNVVVAVRTFDDVNIELRKIFLLSFFPYYYFVFLLNSVANKNEAESHAPRLFLFQRFAILSCYIFIFYTILTILQNMSSTVTSSNYQKIYMLLSRFNDSIFANESYIDEKNQENVQTNSNTSGSYKLSKEVQEINSKINDMKGNLGKSTMTESTFNEYKKKEGKKNIFWVIILIICLLTPLLNVFLNSSQNIYLFTWIILFLINVIGIILHFTR